MSEDIKCSFICNVCCHYLNDNECCKVCNGQGSKWDPKNKEKYKEDPQEYIKNLILACNR